MSGNRNEHLDTRGASLSGSQPFQLSGTQEILYGERERESTVFEADDDGQ